MDSSRGDDTGGLKAVVIVWVNDAFGPSSPKLRGTSKDERGLDSDHTGRLLCPAEWAWDDLTYVNLFLSLGHQLIMF